MRLLVPALLACASTAVIAQTAPEKAEQTATVGGASVGPVLPAAAGKPQIGTFGFDMAARDLSVKPGDDFYDHANGGWEKATTIPADRAAFGMFHVLQDLSLSRTRDILDGAANRPGDKSGDFYASFMDEAAVNARGATPVKPWLAAIAGAGDKTELAVEMAGLQRRGVGTLFGVGVGQDDKAPDQYIVSMRQAGLGLPDRDYYLKDDTKLAGIRTAYQAYLAQLLTLAGEANAATRAKAVFDFETGIATAHWTREDSRDADKTYNKFAPADFPAKAPGFPWHDYAKALGIPQVSALLVAQPSAIAGEARAWSSASLPVLKDYAMLRVLRTYSPYLARAFDKATFDFYGTALTGTPEQQVRWKRGVTLVSNGMGEAVGQAYVARYFPPEAKAQADALVKNLIAAMGDRLRKLEWMAPETKQKALAKLASFTPKIGYPERWRDYSALRITRGDLVGNVARANEFDFQRDLNKLGQSIDRAEWFMTPMTINAYANPTMNEVVFPAAILQPPFFDPKADPAVNYGGIGAVIGHEISHHFDDQGRKYDPTGKLADWWTAQDVTRFKTFTDRLVAQYDAYEPLPGMHVKGGNTLGENIADLAGLTVAIDAYHRSLGGKPAAVIDGVTGDQRFYYGWAQVWRQKMREPAARQQLIADEHAPGHQRVLTVRNLDPWYAAFGAKAGDPLYLAPTERIRIW